MVHWRPGYFRLGQRCRALGWDSRAGLVEAVRRRGFREYYHPHTGAGIGAHGFGWSTLVAALAAGRGEET